MIEHLQTISCIWKQIYILKSVYEFTIPNDNSMGIEYTHS